MTETRTCKASGKSFEITDDDLAFYNKVGIPAPTLCPEERHRRRLLWRNDRTFYKRKSDLTGREGILSIYSEDKPYKIFHQDEWFTDDWDPMEYGRDFDFSRPFFEQYMELRESVPRMGVAVVNCENSDYCNYCTDLKNCYFDLAAEGNEDCYYNLFVKYSKDCVDSTFIYRSTLCYECIHAHNAYNNAFSMYCDDSSDCYFSYDLKGCKNCLFSYNLRNKEYYIENKPYSKEEYLRKLEELNLGSYSQLERAKERWNNHRKKNAIHRDSYISNCENCSGNNLKTCKNCNICFNTTDSEDCKYLYDVLEAKDCYDLNYSLYNPEVSCELISTVNVKYSAFNMECGFNDNIFYCNICFHNSNLFGCVGLRQKKYCIFNKQYSKEEYESLRARIIEHMKKTEEWGEFFPAERSPFGYNETVAQEYFPLTKETALAKGFTWKDSDAKDYREQAYEIPDHIRDVPESIIDEILACTGCKKNFKIVTQELDFYRRRGFPIPRKCNECRHYDRVALRNPRELYERACTKCAKKFMSSFHPNRTEKIYCEACYLESVY